MQVPYRKYFLTKMSIVQIKRIFRRPNKNHINPNLEFFEMRMFNKDFPLEFSFVIKTK